MGPRVLRAVASSAGPAAQDPPCPHPVSPPPPPQPKGTGTARRATHTSDPVCVFPKFSKNMKPHKALYV